MKKEIVKASGVGLGRLNPEQVALIKATVAKGATDDELRLFIAVCNRTGLDPFARQIYFIKRKTWNKDLKKYEEIGTIQTSVDGYRAVAARTNEHAGTDDAVIEEKNGVPIKATVTVYRMIGGEPRAFTATARFAEYAQKYEKDGKEGLMGQWGKMPFLMISKVAECLALRKGFPNDLSGIYSDVEMDQADIQVVVSKPKVVATVEVQPVEKETIKNDAKSRIVVLMKAAGLQPTDNTPEGWQKAVKAAFDMDLVEENYEKIITALEHTNGQPSETV